MNSYLQEESKTINNLLVHLFNDILRIEEEALRIPPYENLSMSEFHVIQAVCHIENNNSMSTIAEALHITVGSLTVAVNTLIKKGYLVKKRWDKDKRVVLVSPTPLGLEVTKHHDAFHKEMTQSIVSYLPENQLALLIDTLKGIDAYFNSKEIDQ